MPKYDSNVLSRARRNELKSMLLFLDRVNDDDIHY